MPARSALPVVVLLLAAAPLLAGGPPAGCAWVRAENDGAGAGFVIDADKKLLVTCRHIVADRAKVDVLFPWIRDGELVTDRAAYLRNRVRLRELGLLVTAKVLKTSDELDLALLELESLPPEVKAVTLAPHPPQPGEALRVVGNRLDLDTVWNVTTGPARVTGRLADGYFWRGKKLGVNANVVIGQLPTEEGDSGGPVFDSRGAVVGMASALRRQCPLAAVVISATEIRKFAGLPDPPATEKHANEIAETLTRATVWVRPTATDVHLAGVLIESDLVLTIGKGLTAGDRCGIAFPIKHGETAKQAKPSPNDEKWVSERAAYRDPLALQLKGYWRAGTVLARDTDRDLALVRLDSPVKSMRAVKLATQVPASGAAIHTMSHPGGLEFAWVYAAGAVRQQGRIAVVPGDRARRVSVLVCQVPAQAGSPGGPMLNDKGELVGIVAAKESAQMVGYAVAVGEIANFLDVALTDRAARTLSGLFARVEALPVLFAAAAARGCAMRAEDSFRAGRLEDAFQDTRAAIALDPSCVLARVCRAKLSLANERPDVALAELDAAVEKGPFDRGVLVFRTELASAAKDWRKARGDLERLLDVDPADADARQRLVGVLLGLGEDAKAAAAVADTLRADPKRLPSVVADLLAQADAMAKKYPDAPSIPAGWLTKALTAAKRDEFAEVLKRAGGVRDDAERLAILRDGLKKVR
jgi:S1-C subfamily serine protease